MSNVFRNYIFIYYRNNHKCNIGMWGFFLAHTQLIVHFGEPSPHGFVLVPKCGNLGWTDLRAKGLPCKRV